MFTKHKKKDVTIATGGKHVTCTKRSGKQNDCQVREGCVDNKSRIGFQFASFCLNYDL